MKVKARGAHKSAHDPFVARLPNHSSKPATSNPFRAIPLAVLHVVEDPKFLWLAGFPSSPSIFASQDCPHPRRYLSSCILPLQKRSLQPGHHGQWWFLLRLWCTGQRELFRFALLRSSCDENLKERTIGKMPPVTDPGPSGRAFVFVMPCH